MKILKINEDTYKVFGNSLVVDNRLPPAVYRIDFDKMTGYSLKVHSPLVVTEKLYGSHEKKTDKIIRSFDMFDRSMGVIFSGKKGTGKSIAARLLCEKMVKKGYPIILVEDSYPGLVTFIDSIKQACVFLFDEFEKNFPVKRDDNEGDVVNGGYQDDFLSLFDGTSQSKRLFLITCNDIHDLSEFIVNRPGRFHYHIRWECPGEEEIRVYLKDKLAPEYYDQINTVINFSMRTDLSYDCLRAIAFELNLGEEFSEIIDDLNIKNTEFLNLNIHIEFKNGKLIELETRIDMSSSNETIYFEDDSKLIFSSIQLKNIDGKLVSDDYKLIDEHGNNIADSVRRVWLDLSLIHI